MHVRTTSLGGSKDTPPVLYLNIYEHDKIHAHSAELSIKMFNKTSEPCATKFLRCPSPRVSLRLMTKTFPCNIQKFFFTVVRITELIGKVLIF